jgi:hypothetical protein
LDVFNVGLCGLVIYTDVCGPGGAGCNCKVVEKCLCVGIVGMLCW